MDPLNTRHKGATGVVQPIAHQASVIQNARQNPGALASRRAHSQRVLQGLPEYDARRRCTGVAVTTPAHGLYAAMMYELAFRDKPSSDLTANRGTALHQPDVLAWTAFNDYDIQHEPQFLGLVDNSGKPGLNEGLHTQQMAVAVAGTRSTYNTSHNTIHAGDYVYWDYPSVVNNKPDRPMITGVPDDKLLAITVGLPASYLHTLNIVNICMGIDVEGANAEERQEDIQAKIQRLNLPSFLDEIVTYAMNAGDFLKTSNADAAAAFYDHGNERLVANDVAPYFPTTNAALETTPHGNRVQVAASGILAEAHAACERLLSARRIGIALKTALSSKQLDLYIRG
jgi:hypothetical protein